MVVKFGRLYYDCSQVERKASNLRIGDLVEYQGTVWEVETVQRAHDFFLHPFIMLVLKSESGLQRVSSRNHKDAKTIAYRRKREVA
jgi:hypothetical protein